MLDSLVTQLSDIEKAINNSETLDDGMKKYLLNRFDVLDKAYRDMKDEMDSYGDPEQW